MSTPCDPDKLMEAYLICVQSKLNGLSELEGECLPEREAYRNCLLDEKKTLEPNKKNTA